MVELTASLLIIGILAAVFLPRLMTPPANPIAADVVASDIRYTQRQAIITRERMAVSFTTGNTYTYAIPADGTGTVRNLHEISASTSIGSAVTITFNSMGEPVSLAAPATIAVNDGQVQSLVSVEPVTGMVSIQ